MAANSELEPVLRFMSDVVVALTSITTANTQAIMSILEDDKAKAVTHLKSSIEQLQRISALAQTGRGTLESENE